MNRIVPFDFQGNQVRTVSINSELYFVGNDVTQLLGYGDYRHAVVNHVDEADKLRVQIDHAGQSREMTVINESGVYDLIFDASRQGRNVDIRRKAKEFRHWVTNEVLPSIRKHGAYMTDKKAYDITHDKDALGDLLLQAGSQLKKKDLVIQELQPKADYTDKILANPGLETVKVIAKNYGMAPGKFNQLLHAFGIQFKQSKTWFLYAKYQDQGYVHIEPFNYLDSKDNQQVSNTMKWTQKGQKFLYDFLKVRGIVPIIEQ